MSSNNGHTNNSRDHTGLSDHTHLTRSDPSVDSTTESLGEAGHIQGLSNHSVFALVMSSQDSPDIYWAEQDAQYEHENTREATRSGTNPTTTIEGTEEGDEEQQQQQQHTASDEDSDQETDYEDSDDEFYGPQYHPLSDPDTDYEDSDVDYYSDLDEDEFPTSIADDEEDDWEYAIRTELLEVILGPRQDFSEQTNNNDATPPPQQQEALDDTEEDPSRVGGSLFDDLPPSPPGHRWGIVAVDQARQHAEGVIATDPELRDCDVYRKLREQPYLDKCTRQLEETGVLHPDYVYHTIGEMGRTLHSRILEHLGEEE